MFAINPFGLCRVSGLMNLAVSFEAQLQAKNNSRRVSDD